MGKGHTLTGGQGFVTPLVTCIELMTCAHQVLGLPFI